MNGHAKMIRQRAEKQIAAQSITVPPARPEDAERILHELRVHEIELDLQNEELRRIQRELEVSRASYLDLYDLAPVGYFTLSEQGLILEPNLTLANLLGIARGRLVMQPLSRFISKDDHDSFYLFCKRRLSTSATGPTPTGQDAAQSLCELRMVRADKSAFWGGVIADPVLIKGETGLRVVVTDITIRKQAEAVLRDMASELDRQVEKRTRELRRLSEELRQENRQRIELEHEVLKISEREQSRVGMDLHDGIGQTLAGIGYLISAAQQSLAQKGVTECCELERVMEVVMKALEQVHEMARGLYFKDMKNDGVIDALRDLAEYTQKMFGIPCQFSTDPAFTLADENIASQFYRIAQEAVTNAAKHSKAKTIKIKLSRGNKDLILTISDTGIGFAGESSKGMGLRIMRYRAEVIGATFTIKSTPGKGTMVTCRLHLHNQPDQETTT